MNFYRQCELRRGTTGQVAWMPEVFSKIGAYLKIHGEDGWRVARVGGRLPEDYVLNHQNDWRNAFPSLT